VTLNGSPIGGLLAVLGGGGGETVGTEVDFDVSISRTTAEALVCRS